MPPLEDVGVQLAEDRSRGHFMSERESSTTPSPPVRPIGTNTSGFKEFSIGWRELSKLGEEGSTQRLEDIGGVAGLAKALEVNLQWGIDGTSEDIARRSHAFGTNTHLEKPPRTLLYFVWEAMQDTLLQVLFVCGIASLAVSIPTNGVGEGIYDGAGIFIALLIIVAVSSVSNYRQSRQFHYLNKEKAKIFVQVTRAGRRQRVVIDDLVVGDVAHLSIGDQVPGDGVLIEGHSIAMDESSMTGESELVFKDSKRPFLLAGCTMMDGFGDMMVTSVGMNTEWGRTMSTLTDENDEETPLQLRLTKVATLMGQMGLFVGIALFVVLLVRYMVEDMNFKHITGDDISVVLNFFILAVTLLVIAIPEGLPLAVALTLAFSVRKMMVDKSLVRHLEACETMGSATTICSDKTGTLTLNQMAVHKAWVGGLLQSTGNLKNNVAPYVLKVLHEGIAQNSSGSVFQPKEGGKTEVSGSPTESAILEWGVQSGMAFQEVRAQGSIVEVAVFSSERKVMGVLLRDPAGVQRCHWKGAAEILLQKCDTWLDEQGTPQPIAEKKAELLGVIGNMALSALRCICLAYRELPAGAPLALQDDHVIIPDTGLTLLAIVGIKDPCRPEVPESVRKCQEAGIQVRMVTGDNLETAKAIAVECGILSPQGVALLGSEFRSMAPDTLRALLPRLQVLARATPSDKLLLVKALKAMEEVVAVTGDGTNDAPALHEADIGLAMGICGTEVAKRSADIVILDDNFASIVRTVSWGRSVHRNIQRFLQFQITTTVVAIGLNFAAALISGDPPLTAVQMLWVDLIQDTFGALALASEPPSKSLLKEPPVDRKESLVTWSMGRNIAAQSVYQLVIMLVLWYHGKEWLGLAGRPGVPNVVEPGPGDEEMVTIIFCLFVFCQIFNEINSRKLDEWNVFEGLLQNRLFLIILVIEVLCQVFIVQFMSEFSGTTHISLREWGLCILIGAGCIPWGLLVKLVPLPRGTSRSNTRARRGEEFTNGGEGNFERLQ